MNKKIYAALAAIGALTASFGACERVAQAVGQPVTVTHDLTVIHPGDVVHFTINGPTQQETSPGSGVMTPVYYNGVVRYTNPLTHSTINWLQLGQRTDYTAGIADVGKTLSVSFCYAVNTGARIKPQSCGVDYITITAAPAPVEVLPA